MYVLGRRKVSDLRLYSLGGAALWWALLRAGVSADIAGVATALCVSTKAVVKSSSGSLERLTDRAISRLSPFSTFGIMPIFALANTAVPFKGLLASGASEAAKFA